MGRSVMSGTAAMGRAPQAVACPVWRLDEFTAALAQGARIALIAAVLGVTVVAQAQGLMSTPKPLAASDLPASPGPAWAALTPEQRKVLAPLEREWGSFSANRKSKWLDISGRFAKMPPAEQARLQERMTTWAKMSPAERGRARLSYQEAKQLSPQARQERWKAYQALPDNERRALAAKAAPPAVSPAPGGSTPKALMGSPSGNPASKPRPPLVQSIAPTIVQAKPGATTTSVSKIAKPPSQPNGRQPVIASKAGQLDRATLLPRAASSAANGLPAGAASAPKI